MEINGLFPQTTSAATTNTGGAQLAQTFETFLTLLTTQLQYQDPLSPMESSEFTSQLVQFASVEQQITQNNNLEEMIALQKGDRTASAVSLLGLRVEAPGHTTALLDGFAEWNYTLPENAETADLLVTDEAGTLVFRSPGETALGLHSFIWDGRDQSGVPMPDGTYTLSVVATDDTGESLAAETSILGTVSGLDSLDGDIILRIGNLTVPLSDVLSIRTPTVFGQQPPTDDG